jgi:hypothetical protein
VFIKDMVGVRFWSISAVWYGETQLLGGVLVIVRCFPARISSSERTFSLSLH